MRKSFESKIITIKHKPVPKQEIWSKILLGELIGKKSFSKTEQAKKELISHAASCAYLLEFLLFYKCPNKNFLDKLGALFKTSKQKKSSLQKALLAKTVSPKVSIYVPAYNAEKLIKRAVDSALNQSYSNLEVCVCDDSSTDRTLTILEKNYKSNPRVKWKTIKHAGIGKASNTAVKMCKGEFIGQLDADDELYPNAVETMLNAMKKNPELGFVYSNCERTNEGGEFVSVNSTLPFYSREILAMRMYIPHFRLFRGECFYKTKGFNENMENAVDYEFLLKLSNVCEGKFVNKILYKYTLTKTGTSLLRREQQTLNAERAREENYKALGIKE